MSMGWYILVACKLSSWDAKPRNYVKICPNCEWVGQKIDTCRCDKPEPIPVRRMKPTFHLSRLLPCATPGQATAFSGSQ